MCFSLLRHQVTLKPTLLWNRLDKQETGKARMGDRPREWAWLWSFKSVIALNAFWCIKLIEANFTLIFSEHLTRLNHESKIGPYWWSACSPHTPTIQVRIVLKSPILFFHLFCSLVIQFFWLSLWLSVSQIPNIVRVRLWPVFRVSISLSLFPLRFLFEMCESKQSDSNILNTFSLTHTHAVSQHSYPHSWC